LWNYVFSASLLQNILHLNFNVYTNKTDEEILTAFQASGDNNLLGILLQRYTLLLLGVGIKYLKDKDLAQDAVQQVFLKAITHLPKDNIQNFKGWLYVLMRNHCLQVLRDKHYLTDEQQLNNLSDAVTNKEEIARKEFALDNINDALEQLEEQQRKSIILFYLKKQSYKQIIEATGYSFEQVKSYIQNGKRNLRLILTQKEANRR
jgi:RNA polymerase sigma-70 factor (ECF subfamily)